MDREQEAWGRGYVYQRFMPSAVHVHFDDCDVDVGLAMGVLVVQPSSEESWVFETKNT